MPSGPAALAGPSPRLRSIPPSWPRTYSSSNRRPRPRRSTSTWARTSIVLASYGHVRDLVPKEGAVDPDDDFAMRYELIEKNEKHVEAITKAAKAADSHLPGDRSGPRGRGDQLAHRRDPEGAQPAQGQGPAPGGVHRNHAQGDPRGGRPPAQDRRRPGRRPAGAPGARLSGRLQPVAGAVAARCSAACPPAACSRRPCA